MRHRMIILNKSNKIFHANHFQSTDETSICNYACKSNNARHHREDDVLMDEIYCNKISYHIT